MSNPKTHVVVMYAGDNVITITGRRGKDTVRVSLAAGRNVIELSDWQAVTDPKTGSSVYELLKKQRKIKELQPVETPEGKATEGVKVLDDKPSINITDFNVEDADEIIDGTANVDELDRFEAEEIANKDRKGVLESIRIQRDRIKKALEGADDSEIADD